ncbi:hypothetical protein ACYOEI_28620 [Singulisphaera rosea]
MDETGVRDTLLFVLTITTLTVFPFVFIIGGVMVIKWASSRGKPTSNGEDE